MFELVYHGGGGFTWSEVMSMPVSERKLNLRFINDHLEKVREAREEREIITADKPKISKPPTMKGKDEVVAKPTYTSTVKSRK